CLDFEPPDDTVRAAARQSGGQARWATRAANARTAATMAAVAARETRMGAGLLRAGRVSLPPEFDGSYEVGFRLRHLRGVDVDVAVVIQLQLVENGREGLDGIVGRLARVRRR